MKNIHIHGRRWFQKSYGNTYHTAEIWIDGACVGKTDIEYGYGDHYLVTARDWLKDHGYLNPSLRRNRYGSVESLKDYCYFNNITLSEDTDDVQRMRDL